jgi:lysophospholipase L1-like esterase
LYCSRDLTRREQYSFMNDGTGAVLQDIYQRRMDFISRGFSGYPSSAALYVAPEIISSLQPDLMTVWFGSNDMSIPVASNVYPHVPLDRYKSNLRAILALIPEETCVILVTPPAFSTAGRRAAFDRGHRPPNVLMRRNETGAETYAAACMEVGTEAQKEGRERLGLVDAHKVTLDAAMELGQGNRDVGLASLLKDGLHPSGEGYKVRLGLFQRQGRRLI